MSKVCKAFFWTQWWAKLLTLIFHQAHLVGTETIQANILECKIKEHIQKVHFNIIKMDVGRFFIDQINSQDFLCTLEYEEGEFL